MENTTNKPKEVNNGHGFRVMPETKKVADQIRDAVIKKYGKAPTYDQIILHHLKASTTELVDEVGKGTITWRDEEKRIKQLYLKKNKAATEDDYERLKCAGKLVSFFEEHSRISFY